MADNEQVTANVGALTISPPDDAEQARAAKFIRRVLGDDVADILAYLGLSAPIILHMDAGPPEKPYEPTMIPTHVEVRS